MLRPKINIISNGICVDLPKQDSITMYVCGPTVYDCIHVGNARTIVVFDTFARFLRKFYNVNFISNITDIDQKIIDRAQEQGVEWRELVHKYIQRYKQDLGYLNVEQFTHMPYATDYIPNIIEAIQSMVDKKFAYISDDGVYFDARSHNVDYIFRGDRTHTQTRLIDKAVNEYDFVLWRFRSQSPYWESPWGNGIPGWHTECAVMINTIVGNTVDIHGGGKDLKFPHHENERIQSISLCGGAFARIWMHTNFVSFNQNKMSKSLGNTVYLNQITDCYPGNVFRFYILKTHYASELHYSQEGLDVAYRELDFLYNVVGECEDSQVCSEFLDALGCNFNTPQAIAIMMSLKDPQKLIFCMNTLGIRQYTYNEWVYQGAEPEEVRNLIRQRNDMRRNKKYKEADEIRERIKAMGIELHDTKEGAKISRVIV